MTGLRLPRSRPSKRFTEAPITAVHCSPGGCPLLEPSRSLYRHGRSSAGDVRKKAELYATRHLNIRRMEALQAWNAGQSLYDAVFVRADTCLVRLPGPRYLIALSAIIEGNVR